MPPARGGNSGIQDVDSLIWKLALVMAGSAPDRLLDSYDVERTAGTDENIGDATRATDFISPKGAARIFRDAVLELDSSAPVVRRHSRTRRRRR